jgi:hypothetical protein
VTGSGSGSGSSTGVDCSCSGVELNGLRPASAAAGLTDSNDSLAFDIAFPNAPPAVAYANTAVVMPTRPYSMTGPPFICKFIKLAILQIYNWKLFHSGWKVF